MRDANRVCKDVASQRIHVQRYAKVQQDERKPNDGHGQRPVAVRRVEQCQDGHVFIRVLGRLQLILEVIGQGDVIPLCNPLDQLAQFVDTATGQEPARRLGQIEPVG